MRAEDLKRLIKGAENKHKAQMKYKEGFEGTDGIWRLLLRLVQHVWDTGAIPYQMLLTIVVLIPKGYSWEYHSIGLLEVNWKFVEQVLD